MEHAIKAHAWVTSCADTFAQQVALHVFASPGGVREHADWYARQRTAVVAALEESGLPFVAPRGLVLRVHALAGRDALARGSQELIERHDVLAIPGVAFGAALEGWLRLSWVAPADRVAEGIARIARYCAS